MQPLSIFKEVVLVPAIEPIPIFGGLAIIFFCRNLIAGFLLADGTNLYHYRSREIPSACSGPFLSFRCALLGVGHGPYVANVNFVPAFEANGGYHAFLLHISASGYAATTIKPKRVNGLERSASLSKT